MELGLHGKTIIVTGGASNIGRSIALAFAAEHTSLVIADIDEQQARTVAAEADTLGATTLVVPTDVTNWEQVQAMVQQVQSRFGRIDVLVNNVGWTVERLFIDKPREEWEKEIQRNLWGMINCTRAVLDTMMAQQQGAVVSIGSDAGRMGEYREGVYAACKAGVMALSKTLAREMGRYNIRFNVVCPGTTMPDEADEIGEHSMWAGDFGQAWNTPEMRQRIARNYPLRRLGRGEDVASAVVFLASDAATFITGQTLSVSGGYTMM